MCGYERVARRRRKKKLTLHNLLDILIFFLNPTIWLSRQQGCWIKFPRNDNHSAASICQRRPTTPASERLTQRMDRRMRPKLGWNMDLQTVIQANCSCFKSLEHLDTFLLCTQIASLSLSVSLSPHYVDHRSSGTEHPHAFGNKTS